MTQGHTNKKALHCWKRYISLTTKFQRRIKEHNLDKPFFTGFRRPFKLIYAELCLNLEDAKRREHYLKTTYGQRFLTKRLQNYHQIKNCQTWYAH